MSDKSGGDVMQGNAGMQGNVSMQDVTDVAAAGVGAVDGMGGDALSAAMGNMTTTQNASQGNMAMTGAGGNDNVNADTNINV